MEQKMNALKTSGKVIAVIMKIGYIAMIVALCVCAAALIFIAATGETSMTAGGVNILVADDLPSDPSEVIVMGTVYFVMSGFLLAIFLLAQRMFGEISVTGHPFTAKHVKTVRVIGILVAAMTLAVGLADAVASAYLSVQTVETYPGAPGIVVGAIIFCLSYILDYGCALEKHAENTEKS